MKKFMAILISVCMITTVMPISVYADTGVSAAEAGEGLSELYREEAQSGKELEESVNCCIIVKANRKPEMYGDAEYVNGTDKIYFYQYSSTDEAEKALEYYQSLSYVQWAEYDGIVETQALSYGNDMVGSEEAMEYIENNDIALSDVTVALLDTGLYFTGDTYEQNSDRLINSGYNFSDSGTENSARADNKHGPEIASIILDNTSDNVKIVGYKVANKSNSGTNASLAMGVAQAVEDGVDIISMSLGGTTPSTLLEEEIDNALDNGVVVICSAGNNGDDVSKYYPASIDGVITVGAIDEDGNRTFFSNYGEEVDFVAPGHYVEAEALGIVTQELGTSFSAAFIDAAAAMVLSVDEDLTPDEVKQRLADTAVPYEDLAYHDGFHAVEEYDYSDPYGTYKRAVVEGDCENEELFYGCGMPQILSAMNITEQNEAVEFSVSSGTYHNEFEVTLTAGENCDIYYTTDETYPSENNATLYTEPITVSSTTSIRAVAFSDSKSKSNAKACEYKMEYYADESDFEITSDGLITDYKGKLTEFIVPDTINSITVTGVADNAFSSDNSIIGIVLPDTATFIGEMAFVSSTLKYFTGKGITHVYDLGLSSEYLLLCDTPNLEYLGFGGLCDAELRTINFPKLTYADELAFYNMQHLSSAYLPLLENVKCGTFEQCFVLRSVNIDSAQTIDYWAFAYCYRLKNLSAQNLTQMICSDTKTVGTEGAFEQCTNFKELTDENFPNLESIGYYTFAGCSSLVTVSLSKVTFLDSCAFTECRKLNYAYLPEVVTVNSATFAETYSLKSIYLPKVKEIGDKAFRNSQIEYAEFPEVESIGEYCFSSYNDFWGYYLQNTKLATIIAPKLKSASDYSFAYVGAVTELDLPNLTTIGENAFYESTINYLYAPSLETAESLLTAEDSVVVTSASLTNCSYDASNATLTIQGERDSYAENYANSYNLEFIDVNDMGRSIRVTDAGLRFGYSFYDTQGKDVEEYGFIYSYSDTDDLKINSSDVKIKTAPNRITHENGITTFNLVFTGIPQSAYDTQISARAYVVIDGKYYYSEILKGSFDEVTQLVLADDEIDEATKNALNNLLNREV